MPAIDFTVESDIDLTTRVQQLSAMFDCPAQQKCAIAFKGELPIEDFEWNVGLIVGPSGCGKSSILTRIFAPPQSLEWSAKSVIDDFPRGVSISDIAAICQSVGFNTIPAWMRPFSVLSNGEKFRVEMARRMLSEGRAGVITMDEFTSVVDRQVAKIGAHAVQKYIRQNGAAIRRCLMPLRHRGLAATGLDLRAGDDALRPEGASTPPSSGRRD